MNIVVLLVALVAIILLPVKVAASILGANNTGLGSVLLAVFLHTCLSIAVQKMVSGQLLHVLLSFAGGSVIFALILGTTMLRGFAISILASVITLIALLLLAGTFLVSHAI